MAKARARNGDHCIPNPREVRTVGERFGPTKAGKGANIVGTVPVDAEQFEENFRHRLPSRKGVEGNRAAQDSDSNEKD